MHARFTISVLLITTSFASAQAVLHISDVLTGASPPHRIDIVLHGIDNLWLMAEGIPSHQHGHAVWGEAELIDADGKVTRLCDLTPASAEVGRGRFIANRNPNGERLRIGTRQLAHGIFAHADSAIHFALKKEYVRFRAVVGIESLAQGNGHVRFTVATTELRIAQHAKPAADKAPME